jgi:nicotinamide-nucleotide amidase
MQQEEPLRIPGLCVMQRLRLTAQGRKEEVEQQLVAKFKELKSRLQDIVVIDEDISFEILLGRLLKEKNKTVSTAESCTGGYIAHLITSVAGSSAYFKGSVVSYDNSIKRDVLHVNEETLMTAGAVSEETVKQMLSGVLGVMRTDYAVAVSGIMGPDGGTAEKPVGTVWIAVGNSEKIQTKKFNFRFDRERNIQLTAINALHLLCMFVQKSN